MAKIPNNNERGQSKFTLTPAVLMNDAHLPEVEGEIDELYTEVDDVGGRISFVEIMDNEYLSYEGEEDEEP